MDGSSHQRACAENVSEHCMDNCRVGANAFTSSHPMELFSGWYTLEVLAQS